MLTFPSALRIYLAVEPVDMRKQFNGLNRKTMVDWVRIAADWAEPIYKLMHDDLLRGHYVQCDETPVKLIDPDEKSRGTTQGYLWVVSAPGGDVVFDWRLSRRHGELSSWSAHAAAS